ncbi:MAG: lipid-binding SYLF domain-containing protein [Pseudomonadota bacterium]
MPHVTRRSLLAASAAAMTLAATPALALTDEEELVERARLTALSMLGSANFEELRSFMQNAQGVLIFPSVIKGGFIIGAEGGRGLLCARQGTTWSYPAFYHLAGASIGLQIGGQISQVMMTIMNKDALDRVLKNNLELGAGASVAIGPIGKKIGAGSTGDFEADIFTFAASEGLFAGLSFKGASIGEDQDRNTYYYGRRLSAADIVLRNAGANSQAESLRQALNT